MQITQILQDIGLSPKESAIYIALLKLGTAKAAHIADAASLQRTTAYDILRTLVRKGLATKFTRGAASFYSADDPRALLRYIDHEQQRQETLIEQKKSTIEAMMPELISITKDRSALPKIKFFEGENGMYEALEDTLKTRGEILAYADIGSIYEAAPQFFPDYLKRRVQKRIPARAIAPDTPRWRETFKRSAAEMRTVKFLPIGENFTPEINIYNNTMLMISWKEKIAVSIESKDLIVQQRVIYNQLWERLPNPK